MVSHLDAMLARLIERIVQAAEHCLIELAGCQLHRVFLVHGQREEPHQVQPICNGIIHQVPDELQAGRKRLELALKRDASDVFTGTAAAAAQINALG